MNRILVWHYEGTKGGGDRIGPAYYMEADYEPVAVRIHAGTAPVIDDAEFEILKDGSSIMNNRAFIEYDIYGKVKTITTSVGLTKGETSAETADDFNGKEIESGSWMTCTLVKASGGENFTIQCELAQVSDEDSEE